MSNTVTPFAGSTQLNTTGSCQHPTGSYCTCSIHIFDGAAEHVKATEPCNIKFLKPAAEHFLNDKPKSVNEQMQLMQALEVMTECRMQSL